MTQDYNNHSSSRMSVGTISSKGSYFKVKTMLCVDSDKWKCELDGAIVSSQ